MVKFHPDSKRKQQIRQGDARPGGSERLNKQLHSQKKIATTAASSGLGCYLVSQLAEDRRKELAAKRNKHTTERRVRNVAKLERKQKVEEKTAEKKARRMKFRGEKDMTDYIENEVAKGSTDFGIDPNDI